MIDWESEMGKALSRAKAEQKCVLLDFYSPECIGCKQMDAVTFPDQDVANFITDRMIPLRAPIGTKTLASDFRVVWTPALVILDYYGKEHQRTVGYLPPDEMVATLLLGIGKVGFNNDQFSEAVIQMNTLLNGYPKSAVAPEAVYLRGVARYKSSHSDGALKEAYQQLLAEYPESKWTRRAEPYSLL
ncbi:MAG TPA: thioredoxin fold domain-containing protein [Geomonas sp.]